MHLLSGNLLPLGHEVFMQLSIALWLVLSVNPCFRELVEKCARKKGISSEQRR